MTLSCLNVPASLMALTSPPRIALNLASVELDLIEPCMNEGALYTSDSEVESFITAAIVVLKRGAWCSSTYGPCCS